MALSIGHVGLNVSDLERSKGFYASLFELDVVQETRRDDGRHFAFLQGGDGIFLTLWQQSDGEFSTATPGLHHLAFVVADVEAVKQFEAKAKSAGAEFIYEGLVRHGDEQTSGGIYFLDPDGIRLEIYAPEGLQEYQPATPGASSCGFF